MDADITNTVTNSPASEETGSMLLEWLNVPIKIFGYSSIQVKVLASVAAIIIFFIITQRFNTQTRSSFVSHHIHFFFTNNLNNQYFLWS